MTQKVILSKKFLSCFQFHFVGLRSFEYIAYLITVSSNRSLVRSTYPLDLLTSDIGYETWDS